jgi:hypothetical protein
MDLIRNDFWGTPMSSPSSHQSFRPVTVLTFRWNHQLHGLEPFGYHLVNVLLHVCVCQAVFAFAVRFIFVGDCLAAKASAALFAVIPVHCEAVASVVGRAELLSALFCILGLLVYAEACRPAGSIRASALLAFAACLLGVLSTFSKEQGFATFALLLAYEFSRVERARRTDCLMGGGRLLIVSLAMITVLCLRLRILANGQPPSFSIVQNPASHHTDWRVRTRTFWYLAARHFLLIFQHTGFSCDYSGGTIPVLDSSTDARLLVAFSVMLPLGLAIAGLTALVVRRAWDASATSRNRRSVGMVSAAWLSLAILVLPFIPSSNLLVYVGFVLAERVMYLPSVGACLGLVLTLRAVTQRILPSASAGPRRNRLVQAAGVAVLGVYFHATLARNADWATPLSLFRSAVRVLPHNAEMHLALGAALDLQPGNELESIALYRRADELHSKSGFVSSPTLLYNLGVALSQRGDLDGSEECYRRAIAADMPAGGRRPSCPFCRYNLGALQIRKIETRTVGGKARISALTEAVQLFTSALDILGRPRGHDQRSNEDCADALARLAWVEGQLGHTKASLQACVAALRLVPLHPIATGICGRGTE